MWLNVLGLAIQTGVSVDAAITWDFSRWMNWRTAGGIRVERPEGKALVGRGKLAGQEVLLAKAADVH